MRELIKILYEKREDYGKTDAVLARIYNGLFDGVDAKSVDMIQSDVNFYLDTVVEVGAVIPDHVEAILQLGGARCPSRARRRSRRAR